MFNTSRIPDPRKPNAVVSAYGGAMMRFGWSLDEFYKWVQSLFYSLQGRIDRHSVSRVDMFVDLVGVESADFVQLAEERRFVTRARDLRTFLAGDEDQIRQAIEGAFERGLQAVISAVTEAYSAGRHRAVADALVAVREGSFDLATFGDSRKGAGVQIGRGDKVCRVYDKIAQLKKVHPERLEPMQEAWGCQDVPVTRVEYQLRSAGLRCHSIVTIWDFEARRTALAEYLVQQWLVACSWYDGVHKERRTIHALWEMVQETFARQFSGGDEPLVRLEVKPDASAGRRFAKTAVSYLRGAVARLCGALQTPELVREAASQLLEEAVDANGGWQKEHLRHVDSMVDLWNRLGGDTQLHVSVIPESVIQSRLLNEVFAE